MIDKRYQGRGYGRQAILGLLDRLRGEYGGCAVYLSVYEENARAIRLYQQIGFRFNGKIDDKGEKIMKYLWKIKPKAQQLLHCDFIMVTATSQSDCKEGKGDYDAYNRDSLF